MEPNVEAFENIDQNEKKAEIELARKEFGLELERIRESKRLTKVKLAQLSQIDRTVISDLEHGKYPPSLEIIGQLSTALEISPYVLLSAYYGIPLPEFNQREKETLENFIKLALDYSTVRNQEPFSIQSKSIAEPITEKGKEGLKKGIAENRRRSTSKKKTETPKDIEK